MIELTELQEEALLAKLSELPESLQGHFKSIVLAIGLAFSAKAENRPRLALIIDHEVSGVCTILTAFANEYDLVQMLDNASSCMREEIAKDAPDKSKMN